MTEPIAGKTALITGAERRIGRATALALAEAGVHVVVHHLGADEAAAEVVAEAESRGVRAWAMAADFAKAEGSEALVARAREAAGSLDILVNNASIFPPDTLDTVAFDAVVANVRVNAWAPLVLSREFARRVGKGKIVNLLDASLGAHATSHAAYALSKHMLGMLTRMTALEFAPDITVNAVAPGLILPPPGEDEAYLVDRAQTVPLRRHGDAQDIADAILFLVTARFVTGQIIYVDGGAHLGEPGSGSPLG